MSFSDPKKSKMTDEHQKSYEVDIMTKSYCVSIAKYCWSCVEIQFDEP